MIIIYSRVSNRCSKFRNKKNTAKARCKFKGNKVSKQIIAFETIIETNYIDQTTGGKLLYVLFVTILYLITQFIGNINNGGS